MPLPNALAKKGMHWYTMLPNELAELVISINPGDRLFFAKLDHRSFINQRLAGLTRINPNTDINLSHALLNSVLGLFYIEALGFGRGLGALDLRSTDLRDRLHMLNPNILNQQQAKDIIAKFSVLKKRPIMPILEELKQADRAEFDEAVLDAYGILHLKDKIKNSLTTLYKIRMSVKN